MPRRYASRSVRSFAARHATYTRRTQAQARRSRAVGFKRQIRSALNKTYTYNIRCPIPPGNINVLTSTYASVLQPYGGTGVPTLLNALYSAGAPGTEASFGMYFTLNDIPQVSTYTALYDQYKIRGITVILQSNGITADGVYSTSTQSNQASDKTLWYTIDEDDAAAISRGAMQEYQTAKCVLINPFTQTPIKIRFTPHIATTAYRSGGFSGYQNEKSSWIDCTYPDVQHFGLKVCFSSPLSASEASTRWSVFVNYVIDFKNVK